MPAPKAVTRYGGESKGREISLTQLFLEQLVDVPQHIIRTWNELVMKELRTPCHPHNQISILPCGPMAPVGFSVRSLMFCVWYASETPQRRQFCSQLC